MKIAQGIRDVYIPNFGEISVKSSVLGSNTLIVALMGVKFMEVHSSMPNFTPSGATYRPYGAKNLKIAL